MATRTGAEQFFREEVERDSFESLDSKYVT